MAMRFYFRAANQSQGDQATMKLSRSVRYTVFPCVLALWLLCTHALAAAGDVQARPSVVPLPARFEAAPGRYRPGAQLRVAKVGVDAGLDRVAALGADLLKAAWQRPVAVGAGRDGARADLTLALTPDAGAGSESYALRVDADGIRLTAATEAGLFYGLQTLRQLLEQSSADAGLGFVAIDDAPRFRWRGL